MNLSIKTYCTRKYRNYLSLQFANNVSLLKKLEKRKNNRHPLPFNS